MKKNAWLYHLTLASGNSLVGTEFEKIIVILKEENDFGKLVLVFLINAFRKRLLASSVFTYK